MAVQSKKVFMKIIVIFIILFGYLIYSQDIDLIGVPGGRVVDLKVHPNQNNEIISSTYEGAIFYSEDGLNVKKIIEQYYGSNNGGADIWLNYSSSEIIYSAISRHTFKSNDLGNNWNLIYSNNGSRSTFLLNPMNPNVVFMTREDKEIWKSYDKGENWFLLKSFNSNLRSIAIARTDTSVLYTGADFTLYKSTDSGENWFRTLDSTVSLSIYQMEVNPYNENSIYFYDFTNKLWKSEDGGYTYKNILNSDWTAGFAVNPQDTAILYSFNSVTGISKTTNEGLTWNLVNNGVPGFANCLEIGSAENGISG
jgi:photosystem II stability/assembly factor-like uncharacterized protein